MPYVRKSFAKHYKDGLIFIDEKNENEIDNEILNMLKNSKEYSIDDEKYKKYSKKAYNYAMKMTERETKQAVEGLYHNLNTLQSRFEVYFLINNIRVSSHRKVCR